MSSKEKKRVRRVYTRELKAEAVRLVRAAEGQVGEVARQLGLADSLVAGWVRRADADAGKSVEGSLAAAEKQELLQLREEVKVLRKERDALRQGSPAPRARERRKSVRDGKAAPVAVLGRLLTGVAQRLLGPRTSQQRGPRARPR